MGKFDSLTGEELDRYVTESAQNVGEKDTEWERRVQQLEATALAKAEVRAATDSQAAGERAATGSQADEAAATAVPQ